MASGKERQPLTIFTIGHSTHPLDEFIAILAAHGVTLLADVRTAPRSRVDGERIIYPGETGATERGSQKGQP